MATAPAPMTSPRATFSRPRIRRASAPTMTSVPVPATAPNTAAVDETMIWWRAVRRTSVGRNDSARPRAATSRAESRRLTLGRRSAPTGGRYQRTRLEHQLSLLRAVRTLLGQPARRPG